MSKNVDLEIGVRSHSRPSKVVSLDRPCMVSYQCSLVTLCLKRTVFEIFDLQVYHDLETRIRDQSRSSKIMPFDPASMTSYWCSIVTIGLSCTISEINGDFRRKPQNFPTPVYWARPMKGFLLEFGIAKGDKKLLWWGYQMVQKVLKYI